MFVLHVAVSRLEGGRMGAASSCSGQRQDVLPLCFNGKITWQIELATELTRQANVACYTSYIYLLTQ